METETKRPVSRDEWGAIYCAPTWVTALLGEVESAGAWTTGIDSDNKGRGSAINTGIYGFDKTRQLALVQVRECEFHPRRHNRVRKDYYLIGRNENGNAFAHPVDVRASGRVVGPDPTAGVRLALSRIWQCASDDLDDIVRNGDVAFVPVKRLPAGAIKLENGAALRVRESHKLVVGKTGSLHQTPDGMLYVRRTARMEHKQHGTSRIKGGCWRIQEGVRARTWGFSTPTAD